MASIHHRAALFAALGDPNRLEIAEEISRSDRTPGELVEKFEMSSALMAHHLDVLEHAGLIERTESHADRRKRFVRLIEQHRPLLVGAPVAASVIFVCRQNSARSQLAAAIWHRIIGTTATSAGTAPAAAVHPLTVQVARQHQLDLRSPVPLQYCASETRGKTVITVCDQSHDDLKRPLSRLHWSLHDPVDDGTMTAFEATYQELVERITPLSK